MASTDDDRVRSVSDCALQRVVSYKVMVMNLRRGTGFPSKVGSDPRLSGRAEALAPETSWGSEQVPKSWLGDQKRLWQVDLLQPRH